MPHPRLIITADDYGMSSKFNCGILEMARAGLITGISVMVKRKYIRKSDLLALDIPLGLHLELKTSSTNRDITTQIERFKNRFGMLPAYLDGHQHKHLLPDNLNQVVRVAKCYRLPIRSRLPADRTFLRHHTVVHQIISFLGIQTNCLYSRNGSVRHIISLSLNSLSILDTTINTVRIPIIVSEKKNSSFSKRPASENLFSRSSSLRTLT